MRWKIWFARDNPAGQTVAVSSHEGSGFALYIYCVYGCSSTEGSTDRAVANRSTLSIDTLTSPRSTAPM